MANKLPRNVLLAFAAIAAGAAVAGAGVAAGRFADAGAEEPLPM